MNTQNEKETLTNGAETAATTNSSAAAAAAAPSLTLKATAKEFVPGGSFKPPVVAAVAAPPIVQPIQQVPVVYPYPFIPAQQNVMYQPQMMNIMQLPNGSFMQVMSPPPYGGAAYYNPTGQYMLDPATGMPVMPAYQQMPPQQQQQQPRGPVVPNNGYNKNNKPQQQQQQSPTHMQQGMSMQQQPRGQYMQGNQRQYATSYPSATVPVSTAAPSISGTAAVVDHSTATGDDTTAPSVSHTPATTTAAAAASACVDTVDVSVAATDHTASTTTTAHKNGTSAVDEVTAAIASFSFTNDDYHNGDAPVVTATATTATDTKALLSEGIQVKDTPTFIDHSATIAAAVSVAPVVTAESTPLAPAAAVEAVRSKSRAASVTVETHFTIEEDKEVGTEPLPPGLTGTTAASVTSATATQPAAETTTQPQQPQQQHPTKPATATTTTSEVVKSKAAAAASSSYVIDDPDTVSPAPTATAPTATTTGTSTGSTTNSSGGNKKDKNAPHKLSASDSDKSDTATATAVSTTGGGSSSTANTPAFTPAAASTTASGGGGASGWRRAEAATLPLTVTAMIAIKDGIIRYDKMSLIKLNRRNKLAPKDIIAQYPIHSQKERFPNLPRGAKEPELAVDESTHEEFQALMKSTGFKFDPDRLSNTDDPAVVIKKANLILNKLSLTNFDKLSEEFMAVGIVNSEETLHSAVDLIVSKAQMEEHFCFMYADLCRKMIDDWSTEEDIKAADTSSGNNAANTSTKDDAEDNDDTAALNNEKPKSLGARFRFQLLDRCRIEFEIDRKKQVQDVKDLDVPADVKLEKEIILKKRYNGHMRFIGEIYMQDLVKPKIMKMCIDSLLENCEDESLVCLCKLMRTIGQKLESYDEQRRKKNVKSTMGKITELINTGMISSSSSGSESKKSDKDKSSDSAAGTESSTDATPTAPPGPIVLSSRIKFMLQDLIDMWKDGWRARIEEAKAKKIGSAAGSSNDSAADDNSQQQQSGGGSGGGNINNKGGKNNIPGSGNSTPSGRPAAASPKFQDARSGGTTRTITKESSVPAAPAVTAEPADEWTTASSKKTKNVTSATATSVTAASGTSGGINRSVSSGGLSRDSGSVGGMFSALSSTNKSKTSTKGLTSGKEQSAAVSGSGSGGSSNKMSGSNSSSQQSGRTVTMSNTSSSTGNSSSSNKTSFNNNNSNNSNSNSNKGPTNSYSNNNNSKNNSNGNGNNNSSNNRPKTSDAGPSSLVITEDPDTDTTTTTSSTNNTATAATAAAEKEVEEEVVEEEVDYTSTPINKDALKSTKAILEEYFVNSVAEDVVMEMRAKTHSISGRMGDVIKYLINCTLERKADDRLKFNEFIIILCTPFDAAATTSGALSPTTAAAAASSSTNGNGSVSNTKGNGNSNTKPLVSVKELQRGLLLFLNDLGEILIDVPYALSYFANILAILLLNSYLEEHSFSLSFLGNIPEENNFSMSIRAHELLCEILSSVMSNVNMDCDADAVGNEGLRKAEAIYTQAGGVELLHKLPPAIDPLNDVITQLANQFNLPFLTASLQ